MKALVLLPGLLVLSLSAEACDHWKNIEWNPVCYECRQNRSRLLCTGSREYKYRENPVCNVDCKLSSWSSWGSCQGSCGHGNKVRTRHVVQNQECQGEPCTGDLEETGNCDTGVCCKVDCKVGLWSSWSSCNAKCEQTGERHRTRTVVRDASCNGAACPEVRDTEACSGPTHCARDCELSRWTDWTACHSDNYVSTEGQQSRFREVINEAAWSGEPCPSKNGLIETQACTVNITREWPAPRKAFFNF